MKDWWPDKERPTGGGGARAGGGGAGHGEDDRDVAGLSDVDDDKEAQMRLLLSNMRRAYADEPRPALPDFHVPEAIDWATVARGSASEAAIVISGRPMTKNVESLSPH